MDELLSVGVDVGTSTTQIVVSRLAVENRGNAFSVPELVIARRQVIYESPIFLTPLRSEQLVDGTAVAKLVEQAYEEAGITRQQVDSGAVIITGETSRKENARQVLGALSGFAGDFVVATAGPDLESVLAAKGAGAVAFSERTGKRVLHMDIGGGTCNLAYIEKGNILRTGCLNVGGRLVKLRGNTVTYVSPVLTGIWDFAPGQPVTEEALMTLTEQLTAVMEMAAGLRPPDYRLEKMTTKEATEPWLCAQADVLSFSGGVAAAMEGEQDAFAYGDIGVLLARSILRSRLCSGAYRLGDQTIRATVIGAGCHSAQLSGSTIYHTGVTLPKKNLPVVMMPVDFTCDDVAAGYKKQDQKEAVLYIPGERAWDYRAVQQVAQTIVRGSEAGEILACLEADVAKALGHAIRLLAPERPCLVIDRVLLAPESFLDIGAPVGPALPVVVKTLVLSQNSERSIYETENNPVG